MLPNQNPDQTNITVGRPGLEPGTDGLRQALSWPHEVRTNTSVDLDFSRSDQDLLG